MADLVLKQNDTRPTLLISLTEGTPATPINLTTATSVRWLMRVEGGTAISRPATITNAASGQITVTFQAADTSVSGTYSGEVEITWNDGGIETVPNDTWFTISILDDIA